MLLAGPFWGMLADKWHCHKTLIVIMCIGSFITMGSPPLLSMKYGDIKINKCPIINKQTNPTTNNLNCTINNKTCTTYLPTNSSDTPILESGQNKYGTLFFVMFFMLIAGSFFEGSGTAFIDTAIIRRAQLDRYRKIDYGRQRFFGAFGAMGGMTFTNLLVEYFPEADVTCYSAVFVAYFIFSIFFTISVLLLYKGLSFKTENHHSQFKDEMKKETFNRLFWQTIRQFDILFFYLVALVVGLLNSPFLSFFFLHLKELGSPSIVLTLVIVIAAISALFGFFFSNKIIKFIGGTWKTFLLSIVTFTVRSFVLTVIMNPWYILIFQFMHLFSFVIFVAAAINHLKQTSPICIMTTMISIFRSLFEGLSLLVGSSISGVVFNKYNGIILFMGNGVFGLVLTIIVSAYIIIKQRNQLSCPVKKIRLINHKEEK